jgi:hypothetical protein
MKVAFAALLAVSLAAATAEARADPRELRETLGVVWEVFWQQQGYLQYVSKWTGPIRVKFSGPSSPAQRKYALETLQRVARVGGIEVSEASDATGPANLELEIVRDFPRAGFYMACRAFRTPPNGVIRHAKISVDESSLRRCLLHEAMHAMGLPGHPRAGSILSYYRDSEQLTATDEFMLKVWYTEEVKPGMLPLPALRIFARRLVEALPAGEARIEGERVAAQFMSETLQQLESFALGAGEPPRLVFRSSTATPSGLERGRTEAQFLVGMAYSFGHATAIDHARGATFFARAAASSHRESQLYMGHAYRVGRGVARDRGGEVQGSDVEAGGQGSAGGTDRSVSSCNEEWPWHSAANRTVAPASTPKAGACPSSSTALRTANSCRSRFPAQTGPRIAWRT